MSVRVAARELGLNPANISNCAHGKTKHTCGYEFEFEAIVRQREEEEAAAAAAAAGGRGCT